LGKIHYGHNHDPSFDEVKNYRPDSDWQVGGHSSAGASTERAAVSSVRKMRLTLSDRERGEKEEDALPDDNPG